MDHAIDRRGLAGRRRQSPPLFLDSAWLRRHYGLGPAEIDRAWRHLPTYRIGDGRKVKVRRDELEAWLEGFRRTP